METQTLEEIKKIYPDEWILLGLNSSDLASQITGNVILHSKDYLELCYKSSEIEKKQLTKIIYTGNQTTNRKWLKLSILNDNQKMI
jgi:hypothetical protein